MLFFMCMHFMARTLAVTANVTDQYCHSYKSRPLRTRLRARPPWQQPWLTNGELYRRGCRTLAIVTTASNLVPRLRGPCRGFGRPGQSCFRQLAATVRTVGTAANEAPREVDGGRGNREPAGSSGSRGDSNKSPGSVRRLMSVTQPRLSQRPQGQPVTSHYSCCAIALPSFLWCDLVSTGRLTSVTRSRLPAASHPGRHAAIQRPPPLRDRILCATSLRRPTLLAKVCRFVDLWDPSTARSGRPGA